jgi:hypothetical protein
MDKTVTSMLLQACIADCENTDSGCNRILL